MKAHAAAKIFPELSGKEYEEFRADVKANGQIEPIWTYKSEILDGRNRYRACKELRIKPTYREYKGDDPIAFVLSANLHRRQLTAGQRAFIALEVEKLEAVAAKERMSEGGKGVENFPPLEKGKARDKAAKAVGANPRYVQDAKRLKKTHPELAEKVEKGEITMSAALDQSQAEKPTRSKQERIEKIREMSAEGNRADQIAEVVGCKVEHVRKLARDNNIVLPDIQLAKTRRLDEKRIIQTTVDGLAGYALGLKTLPKQLSQVTVDEAQEWVESLARSLKVVNQLKKVLQEIANGS